MINQNIEKLIQYAENHQLIEKEDRIWATNRILEALNIDEFTHENSIYDEIKLEEVLENILNYAIDNGIIEDNITAKDLFDTKIMGLLTPRPNEVIKKFPSNLLAEILGVEAAVYFETDIFKILDKYGEY